MGTKNFCEIECKKQVMLNHATEVLTCFHAVRYIGDKELIKM